ncbi:MAG: PilZ domain-containing protein [Tepidisphaeraceae bacterium]|jgi:PilZ domain-containing protein
MRLSAQIIQQIVGRPVERFSGSGCQRALGRVELRSPATIFALEGDFLGDPISVTLRDISAETLGLLTPQALMPFSSLVIAIPLPDSEPLAIRCRVVRCTRLPEGQFSLVAQFVQIIDSQILQCGRTFQPRL